MRRIILSDHPHTRLQQIKAERERQYLSDLATHGKRVAQILSEHEEKMKNYDAEMRAWQSKIDKLKSKRRKAWSRLNVCQAVSYSRMISEVSKDMPAKPKTPVLPCKPIIESTNEKDSMWESGLEGEIKLTEFLNEWLSDGWCMLKGYHNRAGEVDGILVGPEGIFAIEGKNLKGDIYCEGNKWKRDKFDRYGNMVESDVPIRDKTGRGPSVQVNRSADLLQSFLKRSAPACVIRRVVVFTHAASHLAGINNPTVDCVVTLAEWDLKGTFNKSSFKLTDADVEIAIAKIRQDHKYHEDSNMRRRTREAQNSKHHETMGRTCAVSV